MKYFWRYSSPLGEIFMQSDGVNLTALKFGKFSDFGAEFKEQNLQIFGDTCAWLDIYFSGNLPNFTPKISLIGSEFQLEIWRILMQIPFGATTTYGDIAHEISLKRQIPKMSARAVGRAVGANPIAIIIPCHRVIGSGDKLTGYAYGLDKKEFLLNLENAKFRA
ncbi:methylated-DNA--[protein]-cysteine S-methyltransferase [Campylobacter sp. VBCF_06 NA8]|uniref:methylated-DNA--[protein]-cysteine S-methyltransferase n=1 Tax=unclassified Campylobacter TaxID=2593542 RepID=UPI0022E9B0D1|nr:MULTISPECIES: methylated-DNA--[protein]-cysteine S-methyltransferase [unclassified Campylobacter]MDA3045763.1 methylated-DNA--[protein]-cysteine S-methyltransferase [Campylobacter sp. VBCF_06 NA8]MDA3057305.1 methylated-DNA--[protein]-cysteine S-methyltransferase [Campylobacter sp. VBCF_04 NA7]MDA3059123.1 methylated-DNA--[protein]-cysteine S-methyltransferase [Campylobacter sp. VBCF_05 NA6]